MEAIQPRRRATNPPGAAFGRQDVEEYIAATLRKGRWPVHADTPPAELVHIAFLTAREFNKTCQEERRGRPVHRTDDMLLCTADLVAQFKPFTQLPAFLRRCTEPEVPEFIRRDLGLPSVLKKTIVFDARTGNLLMHLDTPLLRVRNWSVISPQEA